MRATNLSYKQTTTLSAKNTGISPHADALLVVGAWSKNRDS